jgi:hypothetical protein
MNDRREELSLSALDAMDEAKRAVEKWPPFHSVHEGYAVILEELDELWEEAKHKNPSKERLREEAIHVAAMAIRFAAELGETAREAAKV